MSDATPMAERHSRVLAELSELGLSLARDLHARALAAETPAEARDLGLAFHRASRSIRQTLALEAKLERDRQRQDREARVEAVREDEVRVQKRRVQVRTAVERLIWTEAEGDEGELLLEELDHLLEEEILSDGFLTSPIEAQIDRLRADLGLADPPPLGEVSPRSGATERVSAADSQRDVLSRPPDPPGESSLDGGASDWRSSA